MTAPKRGGLARHPGRTRPLVEGGAGLRPLGPPRGLAAPAGGGARARRRARDGLPRRHLDPHPPEGGGCRPKGGTRAERDAREALGRPRGGFGTKAVVTAEGGGRAVAFRIVPAQAHEPPHAVRCSPDDPACRCGWWPTAASAATTSASTSGASARGLPSRPAATRRLSPAPSRSAAAATASSASGCDRRRGARWPRTRKRPPAPSSACSASRRPWTGSARGPRDLT
jgi:hypothetical protein